MDGCSLLGAVLQLHSASLHVAVGLRPINVHIKTPTPASRVGISIWMAAHYWEPCFSSIPLRFMSLSGFAL